MKPVNQSCCIVPRTIATPGPRAMLILTLLFVAGCTEEVLETSYGNRSGESVNGTAVLGDLFDQAGHSVTTWRTLSPRLRQADTIVWFPDDLAPPSTAVQSWFDDWLEEDSGRTLIYVGRDYDAAPLYWEKARPLAAAAQWPEIDRRKVIAEGHAISQRKYLQDAHSDWFDVALDSKYRVQSLQGAWSSGIDARQLEIELHSRLIPNATADPLLESSSDVIVSRLAYQPQFSLGTGESQLLIVANGSFLLNLSLVNHEHRKLAGKLIAQVGSPGRVVFLESDPGGPPILDEDPSNNPPTGLEIFGIWPMNFILLHIAAAGIIFCFARAPIFGNARDPLAASRSDFRRHVRALGELLERTRDHAYAESRLAHYRQTVRGDLNQERKIAAPQIDEPLESIQ